MLTVRLSMPLALLALAAAAVPAAAQDFAPHRAVYDLQLKDATEGAQ